MRACLAEAAFGISGPASPHGHRHHHGHIITQVDRTADLACRLRVAAAAAAAAVTAAAAAAVAAGTACARVQEKGKNPYNKWY